MTSKLEQLMQLDKYVDALSTIEEWLKNGPDNNDSLYLYDAEQFFKEIDRLYDLIEKRSYEVQQ